MAKPSQNQNGHSKTKNRSLKSRRFKGIRMRKWGKWVSEIRMPNSTGRLWLGSYATPQKAARAYDFAVYCLRGPKAKLNFPHTPPEIPCACSLSPPQIQAAAAKFAAEEFQLPSEGDASSLSLPHIQPAAAKFTAEELRLPSEDDAAFSSSSSSSEVEYSNNEQEIWAEKGSAFWDSVLLECLESGKSPNLNDFPPLDDSLDYFGVHL